MLLIPTTGQFLPKPKLSTANKEKVFKGTMSWFRHLYENIDNSSDLSLGKGFETLPYSPIGKMKRNKAKKSVQEFARNATVDGLENVSDDMLKKLTRVAGLQLPDFDLEEKENSLAVADAVEWLRLKSVAIDEMSDGDLEKICNLAHLPLPLRVIGKAEKSSFIDDVCSWLRQQNEIDLNDLSDTDIASFAALAGVYLPAAKGMSLSLKDKASTMSQVMEWVHNGAPDLDKLDDTHLDALSKVAMIPLPPFEFSRNDKANAINSAIQWLRNKEGKLSTLDPDGFNALADLTGHFKPRSKMSAGAKKEQRPKL